MDSRPPYDTAAARLGLLYRLPTDGQGVALVVQGQPVGPELSEWSGLRTELTSADALDRLDAGPAEQFSSIALPGTLNRCSAAEVRQLLARLMPLLAPDGVVVGHVQHGMALRFWRHAMAHGPSTRWLAPVTPSRLTAALLAVGLVAPQVHYVLPSIEAPMALLPTQREVARPHFMREVASARIHHGLLAHLLRLGVARAGLSGLLQDTLFFWARKPC